MFQFEMYVLIIVIIVVIVTAVILFFTVILYTYIIYFTNVQCLKINTYIGHRLFSTWRAASVSSFLMNSEIQCHAYYTHLHASIYCF